MSLALHTFLHINEPARNTQAIVWGPCRHPITQEWFHLRSTEGAHPPLQMPKKLTSNSRMPNNI